MFHFFNLKTNKTLTEEENKKKTDEKKKNKMSLVKLQKKKNY